MESINVCPERTLQAGDSVFGFRVLRVEPIPEIRVTVYEVEHEKTGAKLLHLHCADTENLFSVGFRTPPEDSTGVPHILEHSVLAGSARYPVKDAFNELVKGTLQTFINAFTYPDKTVYPAASQVKADFFNLARVYCDLVFHPLLARETFLQEGHHLDISQPGGPDGDLQVSGIVYNEMKGAYSSPDTLMYKYLQERLYPDTPYRYDSGGDPRMIPTLTYEAFKAFHHSYYSPSNARFFIYGNIETREHLAFLQEVLTGFERIEIDSRIPSQPRMNQPVRIRDFFPVGKEESLQAKTALNIGWMMAENTDYEAVLVLEIIAEALVGSAAGPLRKALIDSGLGEDLSPVTGLVTDLKQVMFAAGLRGSEADRMERLETIVADCLRQIADKGIDREILEGALHQIEFGGREIVRRAMPYAISLMQRAYTTWLYDGDPLVMLNFPKRIEDLRRQWKADPELFQRAVRQWFIDNPHKVLSVVEPSPTYTDEMQDEFQAKMAQLKKTLSREDLEKIRNDAESLRKIQAEPDNPEALASLPELKRADLPRAVDKIPTSIESLGEIPVLKHDIFSNGIAYLDLAFDVSDIPEAYQAYLPLLGKLMAGMGAAGFGYEEMAKRMALSTGGLGCHLDTGMLIDGAGHWQTLVFSLRALHRNIPEALAIARDLLCAADFSDHTRMRDLILEARNRLRAAVVPSGHLFARRTAAASMNIPSFRDEQWNGRMQLKLLTDICDRIDEESDALREKIEFLYKRIFQKDRVLINMTGDAEGLSALHEAMDRLIAAMPSGNRIGESQRPDLRPEDAGISIPAQVCYVAKVRQAAFYREPISAPLLVLSRFLSNNYLYKRIRVQGGAYGGMSVYDPGSGLFSFLSYRDPHLLETLKIYAGVPDYIFGQGIDSRDLEKAVIGTIGQLDRPMDPAGRGYTAMVRHLAGLTDELRQQFRDRVLDTSAQDLLEAARLYLSPADERSVVAVYAPNDRLEQANEKLERKLKIEPLP